jgi:hypothetical protein
MFSVATLTLASPVYLRMAENPGFPSLLWLAVQLQVLPTAVLLVADVWFERASFRAWRRWRAVMVAACVVAVARQLQVSFNVPSPSGAWANVLVAVGVLVCAGILATYCASVIARFLTACAPALIAWTIVMAYTFVPPPARAAQEAHASRPLAVYVLLFDELDRDVIMTDGRVGPEWPNFARLARSACVFADATANYAHTCASIGSLLTGRLFEQAPPANRRCLQDLPDFQHENLLTVVAQRFAVRLYAQYLTYCFEAAFQCRGTAYVQARAPYRPLLEHYVPDEVRTATGADRILGPSLHTYTLPVFEQFLADIRATDARGTFSWIHVLLPHSPYVFDAEGAIHRRDYQEPPSLWRDSNEYARALAAYRRQVGFVDRLLGRFLDRLEAEGLAEDAIVIVTADHGFHPLHSFGAREVIDGFEASASRPRVPLIVRAPGVAPGIVTESYQHLDFKRLVLGLIDGTAAPEKTLTSRPKVFCDDAIWHVRDADGQWRPQVGPDGRPLVCSSPF